MAASSMSWLETLRAAEKTCIVQDGRRKIHFTFKDGEEMAEEYDMRSNELLVRKWRRKQTLGGYGRWNFEVGEDFTTHNLELDGLAESVLNPVLLRKDTKKAFQWRIRNLPYPLDVYDVKADPENRQIIIKTSNKKYYKKFHIPDLDRASLPLEQKRISIAHANNTLIVTYEKPPEVLFVENALQEELKKMKASREGDVECAPS